MLTVNSENTVMIAENASELPEKIKQFYDYVDNYSKIKSYTRISDSQIMLENMEGQEAIFDLGLLEPYGHIDNDVLWMGVHTWRFPSLEIAPLFLERDEEIVVIAPCEIPEGMIVGESIHVAQETV